VDWGGQVSANYLANCYVADHARREPWQETRQATITGRVGRVDHTFAAIGKDSCRWRGLTLVHFSAYHEPFLTPRTSPERVNTSSTPAINTPYAPSRRP